MEKKKILMAALACILICVISVAGTLAYLKDSSNNVKNTFIAQGKGKILDDNPDTQDEEGTFKIVESGVKKDDNGNYVIDSTASDVSKLDYEIVPGLSLAKKATIKITGKTTVPAYLYVEVVDKLTQGVYENWSLESYWKKTTAAGPNGGTVYVYAPSGTETAIAATDTEKYADKTFNIIAGDKLVVKSDVTDEKLKTVTGDTLEFYSYLAQKETFTDATAAFTACFAKK